ncbi:hypothetical protein EYC80_005775 [Monilinia laxa]|uniref:Uncharacterized protein n=1 Tax=Monilinia laxa TaxID=61186 RepID=A0A5N6KEY4_MONLA|nr:hypothetical protein EYC80_005775 [Monilinia laxa]
MEDTVMGDLKMEATEPKDAADATSPPMKYYKGRFKHSEKAYFLFLCRKHGIPDLRPEGRKEQHHVREQYALALTAMQAEATKHIKGGELHATDPWEPREYVVGLSVARAWLHKADFGETEVEKERRIKKEQEKKEQEIKAANEHLRLQFKNLKLLGYKKSAPETIDLTED